jgi:hypothetical protein
MLAVERSRGLYRVGSKFAGAGDVVTVVGRLVATVGVVVGFVRAVSI